MADITDTKPTAQDKPEPDAFVESRHADIERLRQAFSDFHKARVTLTDPTVSDDETNDAAMKAQDDAVARIVAYRSAVDWQVWDKFTLLDFLLTEEGGGMECVEYNAIRLVGSIKADLTYLGIGNGRDHS